MTQMLYHYTVAGQKKNEKKLHNCRRGDRKGLRRLISENDQSISNKEILLICANYNLQTVKQKKIK